jgi:hypothetical protein
MRSRASESGLESFVEEVAGERKKDEWLTRPLIKERSDAN